MDVHRRRSIVTSCLSRTSCHRRGGLQLVFGAIEDKPILSIARRYLEILEGDRNVLLSNAKEPADADDCGCDVAIAIDNEIGDISNLVFAGIVDVGFVDFGGEPTARRQRRRRIGHD